VAETPGKSPQPENGHPFDAGPFAWARHPIPFEPFYDPRAGQRALLTALIAWAPLMLLSALERGVRPPDPHESVLVDFAAYGRYLVAAPVFTYAGSVILLRLGGVVREFSDGGLIREADQSRYEALVASTTRLVSSRWTDVTIVVLAYLAMVATTSQLYPAGTATWVAPVSSQTGRLSLAGWWRTLVSQPLFNILLAGWLWRILLWIRFIYRTSRMDLRLVAAHPDRLGGLRFTLSPIRGFSYLAFAFGAVTAGSVAESVFVDGALLRSFAYPVAAQVVSVIAMFAAPMLLFAFPLIRLQGWGILHYGQLASEVGRAFQQRWLAGSHAAGADALGVPDFSATTDLYSIAANVSNMNLWVLNKGLLAMLAVATLLPYVPLVLARMPLVEILKFALKAIA
jgi:hypothetical protein